MSLDFSLQPAFLLNVQQPTLNKTIENEANHYGTRTLREAMIIDISINLP